MNITEQRRKLQNIIWSLDLLIEQAQKTFAEFTLIRLDLEEAGRHLAAAKGAYFDCENRAHKRYVEE